MSIEVKDLEQKLGILLSDRQDLVPILGDLTVVIRLIKRAIATPRKGISNKAPSFRNPPSHFPALWGSGLPCNELHKSLVIPAVRTTKCQLHSLSEALTNLRVLQSEVLQNEITISKKNFIRRVLHCRFGLHCHP